MSNGHFAPKYSGAWMGELHSETNQYTVMLHHSSSVSNLSGGEIIRCLKVAYLKLQGRPNPIIPITGWSLTTKS